MLAPRKSSALYLFPYAAAVFLPLLILFFVFHYKPFWGLMDDAVNIQMASGMQKLGFFSVWWKEFLADLFGNGRLRALYFPMVWFLYGPAGDNSLVTFALNVVFVCGILAYCAFVYGRLAARLFHWDPKATTLGFFLLSFCYPWTHYMFFAPSVQEKLVLLFSALMVDALHRNRNTESQGKWLAILSCVLLLAVNTKEQIVLFFPLFTLLQLEFSANDKKWIRFVFCLSLLVIGTILVWWAGKHGTYKAHYGITAALDNLRSSKSALLFLFVALSAELGALYSLFKNKDWFGFFVKSSFPLGLALFVVIMLPWGLGHYLNSAALIFFLMSLFMILDTAGRIVPVLFKYSDYGYVAIVFVALYTSLMQSGHAFSAYGDLRAILGSAELKRITETGAVFQIPCTEGAERIAQYAGWYYNADLKAKVATENDPHKAFFAGKYWIYSPLRCTSGLDLLGMAKDSKAKMLVLGNKPDGFHLVEILP